MKETHSLTQSVRSLGEKYNREERVAIKIIELGGYCYACVVLFIQSGKKE